MKKFNVIITTDLEGGIGLNSIIPWNFEIVQDFFKSITKTNSIFPGINKSKNILIVGRKTWESMDCKQQPDILTWVITSRCKDLEKENQISQVKFFPTFYSTYQTACKFIDSDIWVIGGKEIYNTALRYWACGQVYWTKIIGLFNCDVSIDMTKYDIDWTHKYICDDTDINSGISYKLEFKQGKLIPNIEAQYLETISDVITTGETRQTRNSITISKFNKTITCDLSKGFPLLTTKKMFWKGIVEELLFFIRGETDSSKLSAQGIKIWEQNTSKHFLNSVGLSYEEGCMGPMYGYQWRHFGKPYPETDSNAHITGIDQLSKIINEIKNDPHSRRILMTDFNPSQVDQGVLYPCHSIIIQFYVQNSKLSTIMYQRSSDMFLGEPFNIASTALLTHIISKLTGLYPGHMNLVLGDYHVYESHICKIYEQLERTPFELPQLKIPNFETLSQVENSSWQDYVLVGYQSAPTIKVHMIA
jgi:thymidylate synthase